MGPIELHGQEREKEPKPDRLRHPALVWTSRGLRIVALGFGGFLVVVYFLQGRIIFPGAATQGADQSKVRPRSGTELVTLTTASGDRVAALFGPALSPDGHALPDASSRPALIYFYGNAMCLAYCDDEFDRFRRLGLNVLIPDYIGYGLSGGKASEIGCRETAEAGFENLRSRGFPANRIIAAGWSLGGAVAIDLASRHPVGGLIAFSTFTNTRDMGKTIFPIALPRWFFRDRFESLRKISDVHCPILLGHGRRDSLIPFSMSERLLAATNPTAPRIVIDEADHNDFFQIGGRKLWEAIAKFVKETQPTP
jgi:fermentation-respiration switch protein FrsA (DUF1100 family)